MMQPKMVVPPADDAFTKGDDFLVAPDIEAVGEMLRERHNLPVGIAFSYRWKRKGGKSGGMATMGKCVKLSGPSKHFGRVDFLIWIAADHCRDLKLGQDQYVPLIYHELLHASVEIDEETFEETPVLVNHDVVGFHAEMRDYGAWSKDLETFVSLAEQAPLWPSGQKMAED